MCYNSCTQVFYYAEVKYITVDSRYLDLAYLKQPLISKWNSGSYFNMEI